MGNRQKSIPSLRFSEFSGEWELRELNGLFKERTEWPTTELPLYSLTIESGIVPKTERYERSFLVISEEDAYKVMHPNDFAFNPMNLRFGALARFKGHRQILVSKYYNIFYCTSKSDPTFCENYLTSHNMIQFYNQMSSGSLDEKKRVHFLDFLKFRLRFPKLPEQQKIAAFLSAIDEKIGQLAGKKKLLLKYKKGLMQQIFDQEIRFNDDNGNAFPDWEEKELGELGTTYGGLGGKSADDFGSGAPYVTYKQIFDSSRIRCDRFERVKIKPKEKQNLVKYGDVFFTTSSETPGEVAFSSVLLDNVENLYLNSFCFGYRAHSQDALRPQFSRYLFRSERFRRIVFRLAQGSTRYNISKNQMMRLMVSLPCSREQSKIAEFLTALDERIDILDQELEKTKTFKKGLLQQMFV